MKVKILSIKYYEISSERKIIKIKRNRKVNNQNTEKAKRP